MAAGVLAEQIHRRTVASRRAHVVDAGRGRLDRRAYELCAAYELRSGLRAGRVWVPGSRRHTDPSTLLLSVDRWQQARAEFTQAVEQPVNGAERLRALAAEQAELLKRLAQERDATIEAQLADGDLVVDGPESAEEGRLRKLIEPRLPEVDLPELLIESTAGPVSPITSPRSRGTAAAGQTCPTSSTP